MKTPNWQKVMQLKSEHFLSHTVFDGLELETLNWEELQALSVHLFNHGFFHEAHESWEEIWQSQTGLPKQFFQGLIQISAGFYHAGNDHVGGMNRMFEMGLSKIAPCPDYYFGIDVGDFREQVNQFQKLAPDNPTYRIKGNRPKIKGEVLDWPVPISLKRSLH